VEGLLGEFAGNTRQMTLAITTQGLGGGAIIKANPNVRALNAALRAAR
jgi:hypothetical protein